jgi:hypothetical protein
MAANRCDVCRGYEVLTTQGETDEKFRCSECCNFLWRLTPKDKLFLRSLWIAF